MIRIVTSGITSMVWWAHVVFMADIAFADGVFCIYCGHCGHQVDVTMAICEGVYRAANMVY